MGNPDHSIVEALRIKKYTNKLGITTELRMDRIGTYRLVTHLFGQEIEINRDTTLEELGLYID